FAQMLLPEHCGGDSLRLHRFSKSAQQLRVNALSSSPAPRRGPLIALVLGITHLSLESRKPKVLFFGWRKWPSSPLPAPPVESQRPTRQFHSTVPSGARHRRCPRPKHCAASPRPPRKVGPPQRWSPSAQWSRRRRPNAA